MENIVGIREVLKQRKMLIVDGSMSTQLEKKGLNLNDSLWTAKALTDCPEMVEQVHTDYLRSGADVHTTCSYQATVPGLMAKGYTEDEALAIIARSVELARKARENWWESEGKTTGRPYPYVAGGIGSYGAYLADGSEYTGDYEVSREELIRFHEPRITALAEAGADLIAIETQPRLDEALICAEICEKKGLDYWMTFSFQNDRQICSGTDIREAAEAVKSLKHIIAVGANCTAPPYISGIIDRLKELTDIPIIVYPNSGKVYDAVTKTWSGAPDGISFGERCRRWYQQGASMIGGCCTTDDEDIAEIYRMYSEEMRAPKMRGAKG